MKTVSLATVSILALAATAFAADLPSDAPEPAVPAFSWTGLYFGVHGGYQFSDAQVELEDVSGPLLERDIAQGILPSRESVEKDGALGGVQVGYNHQIGTFVLGAEADFSALDAEGSTLYREFDPNPPFFAYTNTTFRSELDWLATFRGRAGVTFDRALVYATGGLAVGQVENSMEIEVEGIYSRSPWTSSDTQVGYAVGGGVEYLITDALSLKAEYLYYDLGDQDLHASDPAFGSLDYTFETDGHMVRGGLNVGF